MRKIMPVIVEIISYFFILLFIYAGFSKVLDFENFQVQIGQSPLLSYYTGVISYSVIISEVIIVILLLFKKTRIWGIYASLGLMSAFTAYIYLILEYADFVPCSCGGILENLKWNQHFIFNVICVISLIAAIVISQNIRYRKTITYLPLTFIVIIFSSLGVFFLYLKSENELRRNNNFTRRYVPHALEDEIKLDINYNSFYFAGQDLENIYLGNSTAPLNLTIVKKDLRSFAKFRIPLDTKENKFKNLKVLWKSPYYYIYDGTVPVVYRGNLQNNDVLEQLTLGEMYFDQLNILSDESFVFRSQSSQYKNFVIGSYKNKEIKLHHEIIGTESKGYIDNDGLLLFDDQTKKPLYLYYYKNEFLVFKEFENKNTYVLIGHKQGQKTETVTMPDGSQKIKNALQQTVKNASVSNNLLFVNSTHKAAHDGTMQWNKASIIDIYKIDQQYYSGSFLVPNRHGEKVKDMLIADECLYILIGNEIIKYRFARPLIDKFHR